MLPYVNLRLFHTDKIFKNVFTKCLCLPLSPIPVIMFSRHHSAPFSYSRRKHTFVINSVHLRFYSVQLKRVRSSRNKDYDVTPCHLLDRYPRFV